MKPNSKERMKAVPSPVDEVIAMPTIPIDEFDREIEDEARLMEVALEQLYNCKQDQGEPANTTNAKSKTYPRKGNLSRKQANKRRGKVLTGLDLPHLPDLPAMVARTVSKWEAKTDPECIKALDKEWKSWRMLGFGTSRTCRSGVL